MEVCTFVSANIKYNLLYRVAQNFIFMSADTKRLQTAALDKTDDRKGRQSWAGETLKMKKIKNGEEAIRLLDEADRRLLRPNWRRTIMTSMILKSEINNGLYCDVTFCLFLGST